VLSGKGAVRVWLEVGQDVAGVSLKIHLHGVTLLIHFEARHRDVSCSLQI
jgi:hypothetical protein